MLTELEQILRWDIGVGGGDCLLVAVSGGMDSVALLHLLHSLAPDYPFTLRAAHLDHALRDDSSRDAQFVSGLCARLNIPLTVRRIDVASEARSRRTGVEEAAREIRRAFLEEEAAARGCRWIALGHHRGDQAETVVHRLLRGAFLPGLAGMSPLSGRYIRPLLRFSRPQIASWLTVQGGEWVEDSTNSDPQFTRNRIRHDLLPRLGEFNPRIEEHLCRLARAFALDEDFWRLQVEEALGRLGRLGDEEIRMDLPGLRALHPALRVRVFRRAVEIVRGGLGGIGAVHLEAMERLLSGGGPKPKSTFPAAGSPAVMTSCGCGGFRPIPGGISASLCRGPEVICSRTAGSCVSPWRILLPGRGGMPSSSTSAGSPFPLSCVLRFRGTVFTRRGRRGGKS